MFDLEQSTSGGNIVAPTQLTQVEIVKKDPIDGRITPISQEEFNKASMRKNQDESTDPLSPYTAKKKPGSKGKANIRALIRTAYASKNE